MREILLLATIVLGQLTPNGHLLTQLENKLRLAPKAATTESTPKAVASIITRPTQIGADEYVPSARAVYSIDLTSNAPLAQKNIDERLQIASLTKLMTAYVILKEEKNLDRTFKVTSLTSQDGDSTMGLAVGDEMTVKGLLNGLLIKSGSDAATTLAIGNSGDVTTFVAKMNGAATSLHLRNTHFANPVGWDDPNNYSSARDLTELVRILLRNSTFAEITSTHDTNVQTVSGRNLHLVTTNQLLGNPGYEGVKTGYTYGALECLVSLYKNDKAEILTTVIGSGARFYETESIKGWLITHFSW